MAAETAQREAAERDAASVPAPAEPDALPDAQRARLVARYSAALKDGASVPEAIALVAEMMAEVRAGIPAGKRPSAKATAPASVPAVRTLVAPIGVFAPGTTHVILDVPESTAVRTFDRRTVEALCVRSPRAAWQRGYRTAGLPLATCTLCSRRQPMLVTNPAPDAAPVRSVRRHEATSATVPAGVPAVATVPASVPDAASTLVARLEASVAATAALLAEARALLVAGSTGAKAPASVPAKKAPAVAAEPAKKAPAYVSTHTPEERKALNGQLWRELQELARTHNVAAPDVRGWCEAHPDWQARPWKATRVG